MADISNLGTSISELSTEELHARIRSLRTNRRTRPEKPKKTTRARAKKAPKQKPVKNLKSLAAMMSAEERAELIAMLEESL